MNRIDTRDQLLQACCQDLNSGKRLIVKCLSAITSNVADAELRYTIDALSDAAVVQADRLQATGLADGGPPNLWMKGILDDAARDNRSTAPGALLDVALIGALRKARAAEIVSADTAIYLARAMGSEEVLAAIWTNQLEERQSDEALRAILRRLAPEAAEIAAGWQERRGRPMVALWMIGLAAAAASIAAGCVWSPRRLA